MTETRRRRILICLAAFWVCALPLSCLIGPVAISPAEVFQAFWARLGLTAPPPDQASYLVVGNIRLARVVIAALCGASLAMAGVTLQGVLRNPLADPFTLGISAGAACGASLVIATGEAASPAALLGLSRAGFIAPAALAGALLALFGTIWLGSAKDAALRRESVVLAGIAVSAFLGALVALIKALHEESVTSIVFWLLGSLQGRSWESLPLLLVTFAPGFLVVGLNFRKLDLLCLGDEEAAQLGLNVGRTRFCLLTGAGMMTAGCVAVAGIIAFVGLVVPHLLRMCLGGSHGPLLAGAFFGGGLLLVFADALARCLPGGQELPVGVVTALLGGPFFALLVRRR
ncbi:MAG: iron ABC transporter permease [Desulfovibrio sp.]|jgi:iron complex transport system permease protein|nr:iron ABC transporter permease [Desulfovibrio sp.]